MQPITDISTELKMLLQTVHHIRKIEKGAYLFREGEVAKELFVIQSGKVQINKMIPDGRELTLRMCSPGELIGEMNLFSPSSKHTLNAKIMESGEVAVIYKDTLEAEFERNNALLLECMKWMSKQYQKTQTKFRDLILHGKKGALYSTLIRLSNSYGRQTESGILIDFPFTNQDIANFCGTSREVANRLLSELRKNNVISIEKGIITILNLNHLKKEIDCENCPLDICKID